MNKRELIINAAIKLFVENGFHGTATSKIAQEAGVANGTLFQYFKTKEELIISLYVEIKNELAEYVNQNTKETDNIKEKMKTQILSSLFWSLDNSTKFRFIQQFHTSPYILQVDNSIILKQVEPHFNLIENGIKNGLLKQLPVELIYTLISSQVFGLYQYLTTNKLSKNKQNEAINSVFELLWNMLT